jgi:hypothetical protein
MRLVLSFRGGLDDHVVHVYFQHISYFFFEYFVHHSSYLDDFDKVSIQLYRDELTIVFWSFKPHSCFEWEWYFRLIFFSEDVFFDSGFVVGYT